MTVFKSPTHEGKSICDPDGERVGKKVNDFIAQEDVTLLKIHYSSNANRFSVLMEYEEKSQYL